MRDGRLKGAARVQFESHAAVCARCAHELRALEALGDALRSSTPPELDELHVRRERTRLLAAFDASLMPVPARKWPKVAVVFALAAALLGGVSWLVAAREHALPAAPLAATARTHVAVATVRAEPSARWSRRTEPERETLTLENGTLRVRVEHDSGARRLLVVLPDGELEDIGTTFSVTASSGRTTRVVVEQGRVMLRLHGRPALRLDAGESWSPPTSSAAASASSAIAAPASSATTAAARPASPPPRVALPSAVTPARPSTASPMPSPSASDPAGEFRGALSALNAGDNRRAAQLFAAFLAAHPRDPRGEDASYLQVLALQRAGDPAAMQAAAAAYLRRYPAGFRHAEVEALTR